MKLNVRDYILTVSLTFICKSTHVRKLVGLCTLTLYIHTYKNIVYTHNANKHGLCTHS